MEARVIKVTFRRLPKDDAHDTAEVIREWLMANLDQTDADTEITIKIGI